MVPGGAPIELTVLCRPFPPPPFSLAPEDQASKHEPRVLLTRLTARVAARVVLLLVWGQRSSHPFFLSAPSGCRSSPKMLGESPWAATALTVLAATACCSAPWPLSIPTLVPAHLEPAPAFFFPAVVLQKEKQGKKKLKQVRVIYNSLIFL